jgi:hypothetical protein
LFLPDRLAFVRGGTANVGLDLVQRCNPFQGFFGDAGTLGHVDIKELPPDMSETGDFLDMSTPEQS